MTPAVLSRQNQRILRFKIVSFLALLLFGTYLFFHHGLYIYFVQKEKAVEFINSFQPYGEVVFIALQILQVVAAPIPGEVTGIIGGFLYGPLLGIIYSTLGLTIGSWIAFVLARTFGLPLVEKTVKSEILERYDYLMKHQGILVSFVLFLIPGFPKDCLCYILGLSHIRTGQFLLISTMGRLLGTILLTVSGSYVRSNQYKQLLVILSVSIIFVLAGYLYRDRLLKLLRKKK
ncbi:MAG: TVP38/TMEM64 family inner membrane protein YdjZ [Syntrophus sp. PtaB.Bin001]|nr:MAG: TVP38/TMEM64 family inner membrane protein YdjZ [Syntrophus sp. PtaB.Bin001]